MDKLGIFLVKIKHISLQLYNSMITLAYIWDVEESLYGLY